MLDRKMRMVNGFLYLVSGLAALLAIYILMSGGFALALPCMVVSVLTFLTAQC